MASLTLVPEHLAHVGARFVFQGANEGEECQGCPVQGVCFRLLPGRQYEVVGLRDVRHPCNLHDEGRVRVVEVAEAPVETSLERKLVRGTAATWNPVPCGYPECPRYRLCHPPVESGVRYEIVEHLGPMECPMNYVLDRVRLRRLDG